MKDNEVLQFGGPIPAAHTFEGLYIDDHIVAQVVPAKKFRAPDDRFRDDEIISDSRNKYSSLGLPTSSKKAVTKEPKFTAWGTEVDNKSGRVGSPLIKLKHLAELLQRACSLPRVSKKLLQGLTGLLVHPFLHRRIAMSILQDTFLWIERLSDTEQKPLPVKVKEELLGCALILPLCHSNIRWEVSKRVGASDASLLNGGRAAALVNQTTANTLYRYAEHRGEHVRLDWQSGALQPISQMQRAPPELEHLIADLPWNQTESISFGHRQHINILETRMIHRELRDIVMQSPKALRCVLLVDSRAAAGAWAKGRSSARNLNRIIRQSLGWSLAGRKSIHLVWVRSECNPSDYPSRKRRIPPPPDTPSAVTELAFGPELSEYRKRRSNRDLWRAVNRDGHSGCSAHSVPCRATATDTGSSELKQESGTSLQSGTVLGGCQLNHPALKEWSFREIFAGTGHLTKTFKARNVVRVQTPFEVLRKGKYDPSGDILNDAAFNQLCKDACKPRQYWHFGFPCGSFSLMQNMNKGTRTSDNPLGDGTLPREIKGNEIMQRALYLYRLLHKHGSFFTLENPRTSYAWKTPAMRQLVTDCHCQQADFDQCQFGLTIPFTAGVMGLALKPTRVLGTLPHLDMLVRHCKHDHEHVAVIGGVKHQGKWRKRSELAGAYPPGLCLGFAKAFERSFA